MLAVRNIIAETRHTQSQDLDLSSFTLEDNPIVTDTNYHAWLIDQLEPTSIQKLENRLKHWNTPVNLTTAHSVLQDNLAKALKELSALIDRRAYLGTYVLIDTATDDHGIRLTVSTPKGLAVRYVVGSIDNFRPILIGVPITDLVDYINLLDPMRIDLSQSVKFIPEKIIPNDPESVRRYGKPEVTIIPARYEYTLNIFQGNCKANFIGLPLAELPEVFNKVASESKHLFSIQANLIADIIKALSMSSAKEDNRPVLTTIHIYSKPDNAEIILESADGFRLARHTIPIYASDNVPLFDLCVPAKELNKILAKLRSGKKTDKNKMVDFSRTEDQFIVTCNGGESNIEIDTTYKFPPIDSIIPKTHDYELIVNHGEITALLKAAKPYWKETNNTTRWHLEQQNAGYHLSINAISQDRGDYEQSIQLYAFNSSETDLPNDSSWNAQYILDIEQQIQLLNPNVTTYSLFMRKGFSPVRIDSSNTTIVQMPMSTR